MEHHHEQKVKKILERYNVKFQTKNNKIKLMENQALEKDNTVIFFKVFLFYV